MRFDGRTACFFAPVRERDLVRVTEFYAQDLALLEGLGFRVTLATRWSEIPWGSDLYFVWWWTWAFQPLLKARLLGRRSIVTGVLNLDLYSGRSRAQYALIRASLRAASRNLIVSEFEAERVRAAGATLEWVPLGVDVAVYAPRGAPREEFCLTVCWMKRSNAERKCMFELIRALPLIRERAPRLRFKIAGTLEDGGPELRRLAERLGVGEAVEFLGRISKEDKIRLMQRCSIYLQPTRYEGFGLAIAEAMACGAPVVTSPVAAVPEVVGDCAVYVDGASPESIAGGVTRLAGDEALRGRLAEDGRRRIVERFSAARRQERLTEVLAELLGPDRGSGGRER